MLSPVHIETTATLDLLLHRLLESKALLKKDESKALPKKDWGEFFSLKHNPQFYGEFPNRLADFQLLPYSEIKAISVQNEVTKFKTLHVIVDRESMGRKIVLKNEPKTKILPDWCGNGWQLDDDDVSVAAKKKGR